MSPPPDLVILGAGPAGVGAAYRTARAGHRVVVVERAPGPDLARFPLGGQTTIDLPNDHLQYAITWFSFAAILIAIYLLHHLRRGRASRKGPDA